MAVTPTKQWTEYYTEALIAGMDDTSACHVADVAMEAVSDVSAAERALAEPGPLISLGAFKTKLGI